MNYDWYREPISHQPIFVNDSYEVDWRGTIGVGDSLMGLNCAYALAHLHKHPIKIKFFWEYSQDFLYHYEDPETMTERTNYFHSFYHQPELVTIDHTYDTFDVDLVKRRWRGFGHTKDMNNQKSEMTKILTFQHWPFRKDLYHDGISNRIVLWRPTFNREIPSGGKKWKMTFTVKDWERIIDFLKSKGYNVVELTYRTPMREALYEIRMASFCVFYDGMWQYISRNLCKPVITLGGSGICKVHSPQGVWFKKPDDHFWDYLYNLPRNEKHLQSRANKYKKQLWDKVNVND